LLVSAIIRKEKYKCKTFSDNDPRLKINDDYINGFSV